jgi:type II secretory pathway component PulF
MAMNADNPGGAKKAAATRKPPVKRKAAPKKKTAAAHHVAEAASRLVDEAREQATSAAETPPVELEPARARGGGAVPRAIAVQEAIATRATRGVRKRDIIAFLRQLLMMLQAGTPILKALRSLSKRGEHQGIRNLVAGLTEYVEAGNPLWQAFAREGRYFSPIEVNLIKASEASGTLTTVLKRLVEYRERQASLKTKVAVAAIYPVVLLTACFFVIVVIAKVVIPAFQEIFNKFDIQLNTYTRTFMAVSNWIASYWWVVIAIIVAFYVLYYAWWIRNPVRRLATDRLRLRVPILGHISQRSSIVEFMRTYALLLRSGLSMMVTLDLCRNAVNNRAFVNLIQNMRDSIEGGRGLEQPLREAERGGVLPGVVADMLLTGEETGSIDEIADHIADTYEEEVNIAVSTLGETLQPVLTIFMGVLVVLIALALFYPLVEMISRLAAGAGV